MTGEDEGKSGHFQCVVHFPLFAHRELFFIEKIIRRTVLQERMKVNLDIFSVWFIFPLINEIDTATV